MNADVNVDIPEDDVVLAVMTLRRQPDRQLALQIHPVADFPAAATANALRWLADRLEIAALEEVDGG